MATFYLVLVLVSGQIKVTQPPLTAQACAAQLEAARSIGVKGGCVELK